MRADFHMEIVLFAWLRGRVKAESGGCQQQRRQPTTGQNHPHMVHPMLACRRAWPHHKARHTPTSRLRLDTQCEHNANWQPTTTYLPHHELPAWAAPTATNYCILEATQSLYQPLDCNPASTWCWDNQLNDSNNMSEFAKQDLKRRLLPTPTMETRTYKQT